MIIEKLKRIKRKLVNFKKEISNEYIKHKRIDNPKIFMTLLVKNEEDIIEKNIIFHKSMGVDGFIVTDNNSTDNTPKILEKYKKMGWIKDIIYETDNDYSQVKWVDRMIRLAKEKYKADWIINADADEFWYSNNGNYKVDVKEYTVNKIKCNIYNIIPENEEFYKNTKMIKKSIDDLDKYNLSKFNMYTKQIPKVMHRAKGYKLIHMGNHNVDMKLANEKKTDDIIIFHYSIRGQKHFNEKMINGGKAFERNLKLGKDVGAHWRYFYDGWKTGTLNLNDEFNKSIGSEYIKIFLEKQIIEERNEVKNFFEKITSN